MKPPVGGWARWIRRQSTTVLEALDVDDLIDVMIVNELVRRDRERGHK